MKKLISALLLLLCLVTAVSAAEGFAEDADRLLDWAELLTESEKQALAAKLDELSVRQEMDVVILTTDGVQGGIAAYAEQMYVRGNYGYGREKDGLILVISMEERDWYIATHGCAITAFTDAGVAYIGEKITSDLSDGNYAAAFDTYIGLCDEFITQARNGAPYDIENLPREPLSLIWIPVALLIGFVIAKLIVGSMKRKLKTVRFQAAADSYVKDMNITDSRDLFLYRTLTRTARSNDDERSGSSAHRSSSGGSSFGGSGGKF